MDNFADRLARIASTLLLVIAAITPGAAAAQDGDIEKREFVCMMQDTVMLKPGIPIEHEGRTYYGCCPMCSQKIKSDPARLTKARDPVTGATVDKATAFIYGIGGSAFYFGSEASRREFAMDPARYVGRAEPAGEPGRAPATQLPPDR